VTIDRCNRQWYFDQVVHLRVPDSKPQAFGHALHHLCAAALMGQPVQSNWSEHLSDAEVEESLEFRDKALSKQVLRPRSKLLCEHHFLMPCGPEDIHGVIDVLDMDGVIEDHKVVAAAKWAKTEDDLRTDIPMMIYGGFLLRANPGLGGVVLRHNQFIRDSRKVTFTEVAVPREDVRTFWARTVMPILNVMKATQAAAKWEDVPGHDRKSPACTAYGQCPFHVVCHGGMSVEEFSGAKVEESGVPF